MFIIVCYNNNMIEKYMTMSDGRKSFYRIWNDVNKDNNKNVNLILVHGMTEHSLRYDEFAIFLNKNGITVYALDLRGHGKTGNGYKRGWLSEKNGWMRTILDVIELTHDVKSEFPTYKTVLFGHSMGSYLSRQIVSSFPDEFVAAIFSGTGTPNWVVRTFGPFISSCEKFRIGSKTPSKFMNNMSFNSFNKPFTKEDGSVTGFEWLNRDEKEVQKYIDDPDCGFICTASFYSDLIRGVNKATSKKSASKVNKDLPLLFISGDKDPVGDYSKGVMKAVELYKNAGVKKVEYKLYEGARHELTNELCKDEVFNDVLNFINDNV